MAVFGESYSKFQSRNVSVGTIVDLGYSIIKPNWNLHNVLEKQSVITRVRNYTVIRQDFSEFDVVVNLWKNGDPQATYETIITYNHDTVYFMPHEDSGEYLDDPNTGTPAEFYITKMMPFYLRGDKNVLQDKMLITFKSKVAIDPGSLILDDPGLIDPSNIILLLDGDLDLTASTWKNQVGAMANMNFAPTGVSVSPAGLNGHGVVHFFGGHAFNYARGIITTPVMALSQTTSFTTYFVLMQDTIVGTKYLFDDGVVNLRHFMKQNSPNFSYTVNAAGIVNDGQIPISKWAIMSATIVYGSSASSLRIYEQDGEDTGRQMGNFTLSQDLQGITLGGLVSGYGQADCNYSYVLFREGEDSLATQDSIFDAFKNRFAI